MSVIVKYDGVTGDYDAFKDFFTSLASTLEWDESAQLSNLGRFLSGDARRLYEDKEKTLPQQSITAMLQVLRSKRTLATRRSSRRLAKTQILFVSGL